MFEDFKEKVGALKEFLDKDKKEEDQEVSTGELIYKTQEAKKAYEPSEDQVKLGETEDTGETESIKEILKEQSAKKETEEKETSLEDKLGDIEKVISKFSEQTPLGSSTSMPFEATKPLNLNKPIDYQKQTAKEYLTPVISQQTSNKDRVALLYENLRKQGLI